MAGARPTNKPHTGNKVLFTRLRCDGERGCTPAQYPEGQHITLDVLDNDSKKRDS